MSYRAHKTIACASKTALGTAFATRLIHPQVSSKFLKCLRAHLPATRSPVRPFCNQVADHSFHTRTSFCTAMNLKAAPKNHPGPDAGSHSRLIKQMACETNGCWGHAVTGDAGNSLAGMIGLILQAYSSTAHTKAQSLASRAGQSAQTLV